MHKTVDTVVISDVHLGTSVCRAVELTQYLNSIKPTRVILLGDVFVSRQIKYHHWPEAHRYVIQTLSKLISNGVEVFFLTEDHKEVISLISGLKIGDITVQDTLSLKLNEEMVLFLHCGNVDYKKKRKSKSTKIASGAYGTVIFLNHLLKIIARTLGIEVQSPSKSGKKGVKSARNNAEIYERWVMKSAIKEGFDYVVCSRNNLPKISGYENERGSVIYMNSGDWTEHQTVLEFDGSQWDLFKFQTDHKSSAIPAHEIENLVST